jgi:hypothetical protein
MEHKMFVVMHDRTIYGPFLEYETESFMSTLEGESSAIPLLVPRAKDETRGPTKVYLLEDKDYQAHVDSVKVDTSHMLAGIIQEFYFARRDERVLTVREINDTWEQLSRVRRAVESLMHYADRVVADPSSENLEALRKAFWRNRDSDDVDPHYQDRFW